MSTVIHVYTKYHSSEIIQLNIHISLTCIFILFIGNSVENLSLLNKFQSWVNLFWTLNCVSFVHRKINVVVET